VGMVVQEETSLKLLEEAGANVDSKRKLVKIPQHLIHETLKKIPKEGRNHYGRNSKYDVKTGEHMCFRAGSPVPYTDDINTGEHRFAPKKDLEDTMKLLDGLSNVHICFQPYTISDVPAERIPQHTAEVMLKKHGKARWHGDFWAKRYKRLHQDGGGSRRRNGGTYQKTDDRSMLRTHKSLANRPTAT
jgi:trimethylamine:corrinoid methyltransferase-like protein